MYRGFWDSLKRATTFTGRHGTTRPALGEDPPVTHTLRAGRRRRPQTLRFWMLALPGLVLLAMGILFHALHDHSDVNMSSRVPFGVFPILACMLSLVFAARAASCFRGAKRVAAALVGLGYPIYLATLHLIG